MQLPRVANVPRYQSSAGSEVIDLMERLRRPLDPWQQYVVTSGLGQVWTGARDSDTGLPKPSWAANRCGCWVPRQNGKGDIIMALELGWLFLFGTPLVVHSAHEYKTAQEGFLRIKQVVQGSDDLDPLVNRYWQANGEQGIELKRSAQGARLRFMARTRGAGRGFSAGKIVLDEAQELTEAQIKAILFVVSAQPDWQIWFFGTPPQPESDDQKTSDAWIYNLKEAGERRAKKTMWLDYGLETLDLEDPDDLAILRDPKTWAATNPAMDIRIMRDTIEEELDLLGPGRAFAMERCGMWLPRAQKGADSSIDSKKWEAAIVPETLRHYPQDLTITFHVNARRTHSTIGYAGLGQDGRWQVGVLEHRHGTDWLLGRLVELRDELDPVAFSADVKSETTVKELKEHGIELPEDPDEPLRGQLILPAMGDVATAYGMLVDGANNSQLVHHDQPPLNRAILAPPRPLAGGSTWDHKRGIEVGPANCAGLAMWAHRERLPKIRKGPYDPSANIW